MSNKINTSGKIHTQVIGDRFVFSSKARLNYYPHLGCIFIHIPKNAGSSVQVFLAELDEFLRLSGSQPAFEVPNRAHHKHTKGIVYRDRLEQDIWKNAFKFCVIRNPFDQMVSSYFWWTQIAGKFPGHRKAANYVLSLKDFNGFISDDIGRRRINECLGNPEDWFLDENGNDLVDFFVSYENLEATLISGLSEFCDVPKGISLGTRNATNRTHYSEYYDDASMEALTERFSYISNRFGYAFEKINS